MPDRRDDQDLRALFAEARDAERASTPAFRRMVAATTRRPAGQRLPFPWLAVAAVTGTAVLALALVALGRPMSPGPEATVARQAQHSQDETLGQDDGLQAQDEVVVPPATAEADQSGDVAPPSDESERQPSASDTQPSELAVQATEPVPPEEEPAPVRHIERRPAPPPAPHVPLALAAERTPASAEPQAPAGVARPSVHPLRGTGGVIVQVSDAQGPLPGAIVTLSHESGMVKESAVPTSVKGIAEFPLLRATEPASVGYTVSVAMPGFTRQRVHDVKARSGEVTRLPVELSEEIVERLTVLAASEVVDLERTAVAAKLSDEHIQDLAVPGRFYRNVITLAPGAQDSDGDGDPDIVGSRERDFKATVAGRLEFTPLTGQQTSQADPESIEEMAVVTAGAGVPFSRARGGFARIVQKQGGGEEMYEAAAGFNTESYAPIEENDFLTVADSPLSTFSIDVDTASYANTRRYLSAGRLPPRDAVRIEELINYFDYDYPPPPGDAPFSVSVEVAECPWNPAHRLARVGLRGREVEPGEHNGRNLVFLIDVSGSMQSRAKLPLLKRALELLTRQLTARDTVAMVVYAGASGLALEPTSGADQASILEAIDRLETGGSTNGGAGLRLAYAIARENYVPGGVNRVILATDGDFNVGVTSQAELLQTIKRDAGNGIFLTALGFGYGNLQDDMLEHLADKGNGNYAYIDRMSEARKVLVEELSGTLVTIAKDVKIQIEFNPREVGAYRLIGYENRRLQNRDFNDDRKDAGEIGAGHTVTALYELVPPEADRAVPEVDPLRYQGQTRDTEAAASGELLTLKLRYKEPEGTRSRLLIFPVRNESLSYSAASDDFRFAAAVASFGMLLRDSRYCGSGTFEAVRARAIEAVGADPNGRRGEFLELVGKARDLRLAEEGGSHEDP